MSSLDCAFPAHNLRNQGACGYRGTKRTGVARRGLTLMELIVVLVVLVAIAGILLPILPSMLTRAEVATDATNHQEISKAIMTHESVYMRYPNGYDRCLTSSGTRPSYILDEGSTLTTMTPTATEASALASAGITSVFDFSDTTTSPTFDPYASTTATTISGSTALLSLTTAGQQRLNLPTGADYHYVVLGLGKRCDLFGRSALEPPTHFADKPSISPNIVYARYGAVFVVAVPGTTAGTPRVLSRAKFVRSVEFEDEGVGSGDGHIEEFWKIQDDAAQTP